MFAVYPSHYSVIFMKTATMLFWTPFYILHLTQYLTYKRCSVNTVLVKWVNLGSGWYLARTEGEIQFLREQMLNLKKLLRYVYVSTFYHTQCFSIAKSFANILLKFLFVCLFWRLENQSSMITGNHGLFQTFIKAKSRELSNGVGGKRQRD